MGDAMLAMASAVVILSRKHLLETARKGSLSRCFCQIQDLNFVFYANKRTVRQAPVAAALHVPEVNVLFEIVEHTCDV